MNKTIAAISTPFGNGGIGIVRISGNVSREIVNKIFRPVNPEKNIITAKGYTSIYGHIIDGDEIIDEVICFIYNAPYSYTGEDVIEISAHGSLTILKEILFLAVKNGAQFAEAGEFTKRAFLNGKIDLTRAEAVMDLINAKNENARRVAISIKEGTLYKKINIIKDKLINIAANIAVYIDYPEEDIMDLNTEEMIKDLNDCKADLDKLSESYETFKINKDGINIVIAGKPNVGKSTLMNILSGAEKSIVTNIPGTTRDIVSENITIKGIPINLYDTAGIHETNDPIEKIGVDKTKLKLETADVILAIFDASDELSEEDYNLINKYSLNDNIITIINKTDLTNKIDIEYIKDKFKHIVYISAKEERGIDEILEHINKYLKINEVDYSQGIIINERQNQCIKKAYEFINETIDGINLNLTLDVCSINLDEVINALLELTGEKASELIVERVFHNFCVGK